MGSSSPSERSTGRSGSSIRRAGRPSARPLDEGTRRVWQLAFSPDGRLLAVAVDPNGVDGFNVQRRQGEVQLWDVDSRQSRGAGDRAGRRIGALRGLQPGRHAARDRQLQRAARPVGCGHPGPPRQADEGGGRRRPERRVRSERPSSSPAAERSGRCGCGAWPISGRPFRLSPATPARSPGRRSTRPARSSRPRACSAGPGCGTRPRVSATATSWSEARGPARSTPSIDLPFLGLRNAFSPDGKLLAVAGVETLAMLWDVDPAVWRRRACAIAGRNLTREEWKLYLPAGTPYRATCSEWPTAESSAGHPCRTVRNCSLRATQRRPGRGIVRRARRASMLLTKTSRMEVRHENQTDVQIAPRVGIVSVAFLHFVDGAAASGTSAATRVPAAAALLPGARRLDGLRLPADQGEVAARPSEFDTGYVDVFAARLRKLSPKIQVVNYGCPGESTVTFTRGGCPGLARRHQAARRVSRIPAQGGRAVPASAPRAGQPDHRDAVGRRPGSAVGRRQARAARRSRRSLRASARSSSSFGPPRRPPRSSSPEPGTPRPIDSHRPSRSTARSTRRSHEPRRRRARVSRTCSRR